MNKPFWLIKLRAESIFNLNKGDVFRWYDCASMPKFTFIELMDAKIHCLTSEGFNFTWSLNKNSEKIFIL